MPPPPSVKTDSLSLPVVLSKSSALVASGMRATMPAMMMRLMPLPMPYSSICSPSHIRKIVPAVMVRTAAMTSRQNAVVARDGEAHAACGLRADDVA